MTETRSTSDRRPLAIGIALATALYAVVYRFVPYEAQAYLLWPFGALALYSGARLRLWQAVLLIFLVQAGTDLAFYAMNSWKIPIATYMCFGLFVLLGVCVRPLLRIHWLAASLGLFATSIVGYAIFFFITNTAAWIENSRQYYQPHTFETLMQAYGEGLEFLRARPWQFFSNPICVGLVFGAHVLFARTFFTSEQFGVEQSR